jgi:hypothetical protein
VLILDRDHDQILGPQQGRIISGTEIRVMGTPILLDQRDAALGDALCACRG